ncbi:cilia- and flagella-associated protein 74-like [Acropora millepora]|uniref:cilia- and flagella-associated protein 74-like n=1 Tax=Acropora millepora TaxID=45264 RepID=UPI001CF1503B|nr:cilia- and flagella-associated protein 74-like [Acropora millepora]
MAEVDLDEEVIELSTEEPRSDNTNEIATKDFMNGERSRESIHNHWQFSDEGPIEYESDPSSDIDKNYFSDQESLTGSMDGGLEEDEYTSDPIAQQTRQEKLQHLALRRHLDKLSEQVLEKDYLVSQFREELKKCEDHIEELQKQKEMVNSEIEEAESQNNMASLYRLQGFDSKLCAEIDAEKDVHRDIFHRLQEAEFALAQATVEQGKFLLAGNELEKQDKLVEKQKADQSAVRLRKENMSAVVSDRRRRAREKEHISALRERERKHRQAIAAAKRNREQASKFLKETMSRVRQKETEEEERSREYMQDRMQAILSLKNNIETNKENLRALQARDAKKRLEKEEEELLERQEILAEGLNPDEELTRRKRIRQFEKDKEAYERRQRERQVEIADSIMKEEKQMKKRYQQQPHLWPDKQRERVKRINRRRPKPKFFKSTSGSSSVEYSADIEDTGGQHFAGKLGAVSSEDDEDDFSPFGETSRDEAKEGDSEGEGEELAQPEFRGLWEEDVHKESGKSERRFKFATHIPSKMEQEMMENALMKQRAGIVQKQIAVGREFKGCAFYSKPEVITFKDFDVGKSYKKKILLTNISYTQNYCKYVGMSHILKDFVEVFFEPPGVMSAGLTCDFTVTFKPMLNEDLEGHIDFLAQTGPFSVPIRCVTKKCQISVDVTEVEFGSQVLGETRKRVINVTNNGALGTQFEFKKITGLARSNTSSELISIGGMTATDVNVTHQDFKQNVEQHNPEEMVEDTKEPQGGGVQTAPGDAAYQDATDRSPDPGVSSDDRVTEGLGTTERATSVLAERTVEETDVDGTPGAPQTASSTVPTEVSILEGLRVGKLSSGEIAAFSLVQLEVIFNPTKSGNAQAEFEISFSDPLSPPIVIRVRGVGIDVPVWVEREVVDLKICMYDRLYQDAILVNNRATSALRLKFEVCKELKNHLELLPKTAYIQAESQFSAQLKFLPRQTLPGDCPTYFDHETRLLEAPMVIRVADQTRPVPFSVRAVVTSSDIEFNAQDIDFGFCTVLESVRRTVTVTNKSVLPQQFGFCGVPDTIDVQPNDGFGTLLPLESYDVDIMFNAKKAKEYDFDLTCKTGIGREFTLHCRAVGVLPPLELSHSVIKMKATAVSDTCSSHIEVINSHTSANEFTHPVPRIGSGPIVEVGSTSFEFVLPAEAPLTISPAVGTVGPGQRCLVHVTFSPRIDPNMLRLESVRMMEREAEAKRKRLERTSPQDKPQDQPAGQKKKGGKPTAAGKSAKTSPKRGVTPSSTNLATRAKSPEKTFSTEDVVDGSNDYDSAHLSLLRTYQNTFSRYVIPCFVAFGKCTEPNTLSCSPHNTMYLEVHCPAVRPHVVVVSDCGRTVVDFENVSLGQAEVKTFTIQNISDEPCELTSSLLDPHGPFQMLNALRVLAPQATHNVAISFGPLTAKEFHELLEVRCPRNTLNIKLKGRGVQPVISLSVEDGLLDVGDALVGDTISSSFTISNNSELSINYSLKLDSLSPLRHSRAQVLPNFLPPFCEMAETQLHVLGPSNYNGMAVFNCVPAHGTIGPGESKEVTVSFSPDHASELYADEVSVEINSGDKPYAVKLLGRGWQNIMYTRGWDELMPRAESLRAEVEEEEEEDQGKALQKTVLLTMKSISTPRGFEAAERSVEIGCIKSSIQIKKSCDFAFDNPKEANERGFNFDPLKAGVDIGTKRNIVFRWQPPPGHDPNFPVNTATVLTVKSDVTTQYKILLQGLIATAQRDPGVENHVDSTVLET